LPWEIKELRQEKRVAEEIEAKGCGGGSDGESEGVGAENIRR
jgi:hypothetical protein